MLPKASYAVQLGDGRVAQAGTIEELRKSGAIDEILQIEDVEQQDETIDEPLEHEIVKVKSVQTTKDPKAKPRKFVEDEHRAKGKVKAAVYTQYLSVTGGVSWWSL